MNAVRSKSVRVNYAPTMRRELRLDGDHGISQDGRGAAADGSRPCRKSTITRLATGHEPNDERARGKSSGRHPFRRSGPRYAMVSATPSMTCVSTSPQPGHLKLRISG